MKNVIKLSGLSLLFIIFLAACNRQPGTQGTETTTIERDTVAGIDIGDNDMTIDDLKTDLRELSDDIDEAVSKEGDEFKNDAERVVTDVNQRIERFENRADRQDEDIDLETREALENLRTAGQELEEKLENYDDTNRTDYEQFREEVKRDFSVFGESVKDFFEDNV